MDSPGISPAPAPRSSSGVIGSEYACTFAALGTEVHVLDGRGDLLSFLDAEVARALTGAMERNGIVFHWMEQVRNCGPRASAGVTLSLLSGNTLTVDAVLVAAGRKSNVVSLNLAAAGVVAGENGVIAVDEFYRTTMPYILLPAM